MRPARRDGNLALVAARWARALGAALVLLGLLAGVPAVLLLWGDWPITGLPTGEQVRELPSTLASDAALIAAFTVALWVAWALFVLACAVEVVAEVRGRHARRLAVAGPLQDLAARLVATVAVTLGSLGPVAVAAAPRPPAVVPVAAVRAPAGPAAAAGATLTVTVAPGDSPWALAERHLGDGTRWSELWDANRDRRQPDGRTWDEPGLVRPGWQLVLPGGAAAPAVAGGGRVVVVEPDDNPWTLAERHLGEGTRWRELFAINRGRPQADGDAWVAESHVEPGWVIELPGSPAPPFVGAPARVTTRPVHDVDAGPGVAGHRAPAAGAAEDRAPGPGVTEDGSGASGAGDGSHAEGATAGASSGASAADDSSAGAAEAPSPAADAADPAGDARAEDGDDDDLDIVPVAVGGVSALLAAGVVLQLDTRRRRRLRRRSRGPAEPTPPVVEPETVATERRWRAVADHESAQWVDAAVRHLTRAVREAGTAVPVAGLRVGPAGVDLLLAEPRPGGAGRFVADATGTTWSLDADDLDELRDLAAGEVPYTPGLVTLGTGDDGSTVLVDVEHLGLLSVEGDARVVRAWLTAVALDVATAPWASEVDLRLVGGLTELAALDQVSLIDPAEVAPAVRGAVTATVRALGPARSTQVARAWPGAEPWPPLTVVVSTAGTGAPVAEAAAGGRGAAVVAVGPVPRATHRLTVGADGHGTLYPLGLPVRLSEVDAETARDTARLLVGAPDVAGPAAPAPRPATPPTAPAPFAPLSGARPAVDAEVRAKYAALIRSILEPAEVEVVVLGRPSVSGWTSEPRQRSVEIVCYLATHDGPVTGERLRDSIFPAGFKATSLRQAVSRTRTALGRSAGGEPHILPATRDGSYALGPGVRCDAGRFQALVAAARKAPEACEIDLLRTALALVRGQPFSDCPPGGYGWASAEGITYTLERLIVDTAQRLNELAFAGGDARLAEWASRQGQRAVPGHEGLWCDLALAKLHQDDVEGFSAVRREAEASAAAFDELEGLQPETHEFFARVLAQYRNLRDAAEGG